MSPRAPFVSGSQPGITQVPSWITSGSILGPEEIAFRTGAALAHLHPIVIGRAGGDDAGEPAAGVPLALLRDRMALTAAEACIMRSGGRARRADLRDRIAFLVPDTRMDPETAQFAFFRRAGSTGLRGGGLARLLPDGMKDIGNGSDRRRSLRQGNIERTDRSTRRGNDEGLPPEDKTGDPISQAVRVLTRLPEASSEQKLTILMLSDAVLARALDWPVLLPLLSAGLSCRDLQLDGTELHQACCAAILRESVRAVRLAADLERRAGRLLALAPKLRAKGARAAVTLFLARDAVAPTMDLSPVVRGTKVRMSPRAAGRLCDRLVELGAIRELTGRPTFRLYGL